MIPATKIGVRNLCKLKAGTFFDWLTRIHYVINVIESAWPSVMQRHGLALARAMVGGAGTSAHAHAIVSADDFVHEESPLEVFLLPPASQDQQLLQLIGTRVSTDGSYDIVENVSG